MFGRYLFAVGKNEEAARYSGIRSQVIIASAYVMRRRIAGVSSIYLAMYTRSISPASHGNFYELYAIGRRGARRLFAPGRRGLGAWHRARRGAAADPAELVNLLGIPSSLNFAVMGGVILIGVIADQQLVRYRTKKANARKRTPGHGALSPAAEEK